MTRRRITIKRVSLLPAAGTGLAGCLLHLAAYVAILLGSAWLFRYDMQMIFGYECPLPLAIIGGVVFAALGGSVLIVAILCAILSLFFPVPFFPM